MNKHCVSIKKIFFALTISFCLVFATLTNSPIFEQNAKALGDNVPANTLMPKYGNPDTDAFYNNSDGVLSENIISVSFENEVASSYQCSGTKTSVGVGHSDDVALCLIGSGNAYKAVFVADGGVRANDDSSGAFSYIGKNNSSGGKIKLDFSNFDASQAINMKGMFANVGTDSNVQGVELFDFEKGFGSSATDMSGMFGNYAAYNPSAPAIFGSALTFPKFPDGFGSNATDMSYMFAQSGINIHSSSIIIPSFPSGFGSKATNMSFMFNGFGAFFSGKSIEFPSSFPSGFGQNLENFDNAFNQFAKEAQAEKYFNFPSFPSDFGKKLKSINGTFSSFFADSGIYSINIPEFPSDFGQNLVSANDAFSNFLVNAKNLTTPITLDFTQCVFPKLSKENTENMFSAFNSTTKNNLYTSNLEDLTILIKSSGFSNNSFKGDLKYAPYNPKDVSADSVAATTAKIYYSPITADSQMITPSQYHCEIKGGKWDSWSSCSLAKDLTQSTLGQKEFIKINNLIASTEYTVKLSTKYKINNIEKTSIGTQQEISFKTAYKENTVHFDPQGGILDSKYITEQIKTGGVVDQPPNPTKDGFIFDAWYLTSTVVYNKDKSYNFNTPVVEDITLYAHWIGIKKIATTQTNYNNKIYLKPNSSANLKLVAYPDFNENKGVYGDFNLDTTIQNTNIITSVNAPKTIKTNTTISLPINAGSTQGTSDLTVKMGLKSYSFKITVTNNGTDKVKSLSIKGIPTKGANKDLLIIKDWNPIFLQLNISPSNVYNAIPTWKVLDAKSKRILSIDSAGKLIPKKPNLAYLQVTVANKTYKFSVKVKSPVEKIYLSKKSNKKPIQAKSIIIKKNKIVKLYLMTIAKTFLGSSETLKVTPTYSKKSIVKVYMKNGKTITTMPNEYKPIKIKRLKQGKITLTLTAPDGKSVKVLIK